MDNFFPEINAELNRRRIIEEMNGIRLEEEAVKGKHPLSGRLASLCEWLIALGEKLRKPRSSPGAETRSTDLIRRTA